MSASFQIFFSFYFLFSLFFFILVSLIYTKLEDNECFIYRWRLCDELLKIDVKNGVMHRPSQDSDVSILIEFNL